MLDPARAYHLASRRVEHARPLPHVYKNRWHWPILQFATQSYQLRIRISQLGEIRSALFLRRGRACSTLPGRITWPQEGSSMLDPYRTSTKIGGIGHSCNLQHSHTNSGLGFRSSARYVVRFSCVGVEHARPCPGVLLGLKKGRACSTPTARPQK